MASRSGDASSDGSGDAPRRNCGSAARFLLSAEQPSLNQLACGSQEGFPHGPKQHELDLSTQRTTLWKRICTGCGYRALVKLPHSVALVRRALRRREPMMNHRRSCSRSSHAVHTAVSRASKGMRARGDDLFGVARSPRGSPWRPARTVVEGHPRFTRVCLNIREGPDLFCAARVIAGRNDVSEQ